MYINSELPLEQWLDSVPDVVAQIVQDYKEERGVNTPKPRDVASWLINKLGGNIGPSLEKALDVDTAGYLIPVKPTKTTPTLYTESLPTGDGVCAMMMNPRTCPEGARRMAAKMKVKLSKKAKGGKTEKKEKKEKVASDSDDFEEDVEGEEVENIIEGDSDEENDDSIIEQVDDRFDHLEVNTVKDLDAMLEESAGVSITTNAPKENRQVSKRYQTLEAMTLKSDRTVDDSLPKPAQMIREVVKMNPGDKHDMNDAKQKRKLEAQRKLNELDAFDKMKRQIITPEIRQELQAIALRAYVRPGQHYRGAKRKFELAEAESGFFQVGYSVAGGLHDKPLNADGSTPVTYTPTSKRKKSKSLVKSLLY